MEINDKKLADNLQLIVNQLGIELKEIAEIFGKSGEAVRLWIAGRPQIPFLLWLEEKSNIPIAIMYTQNLSEKQVQNYISKKKLDNQVIFEPGENTYEKGTEFKNMLVALQSRIEILEKTHLLRAGHTEQLEEMMNELKNEIDRLKKELKK